MKHILLASLLFTGCLYSFSDEFFRFRLALRPARMAEVKEVETLPVLETNHLILKVREKESKSFDQIETDLGLFTCGKEPKDAFQWIIEHKEYKKKIGFLGLYNIDKKNASAVLALFFEKEYREKDLIADAMRAIITFSYRDIGLNRLDFYLYPDEIGFADMSQLCDSFGFIKVGELPEYIYRNGCYYNFILYSLLQQNAKNN